MWSVVEKTALAEAEVEYQDYTSDTMWVKFPVRTTSSSVSFASIKNRETCNDLMAKLQLAQLSGRCHLDHHAMDHPRQPRHRFSSRFTMAFIE